MSKLFAVLLALLLTSPVFAIDWTVDRTRGDAVYQVGGVWQALARGTLIADDQMIKTGANGHVGLRRGAESIKLGSNTQVRIHDAGAALMTTVQQDYGTVTVEAERRHVQHFSVTTPFLAAVVKGTQFTVTFDGKVSEVSVQRGKVQVQDQLHSLVTDITPGHDASVSEREPLTVSGAGSTPVFAFNGTTVTPLPQADTSSPVAPDATTRSANRPNAKPGTVRFDGNVYANGEETGRDRDHGNGGSGNGNGRDHDSANGSGGSGNSSGNGRQESGNDNGNGNAGNGNSNGNGNNHNGEGSGNGQSGNGNNGNNGNGNHDDENEDEGNGGNSDGNHDD